MRRDFSKNIILFAIMAVLFGALLVSFINYFCNDGRQNGNAEEQITVSQEIFEYRDETNGFSIQVPSSWTALEDSDTVFFLSEGSSGVMKIDVEDYSSSIEDISEEEIKQSVSEDEKTFESFDKVSDGHYEVAYLDKGIRTFCYREEILWNSKCIVHLLCMYEQGGKDSVQNILTDALASFRWNKQQ